MLNLHIYTDETYTLDIFCFRVIKLKLWPQLPFVSLVALNGADYSMCSWVFSEASLHQQILRHQTLTIVHRSLARYTCRPTPSAAMSSLLNANFTHARPLLASDFIATWKRRRLKQSTHCTQRSWLSGCCFCYFYYRGMSGDQTALTLGQCRVTCAYHTCIYWR